MAFDEKLAERLRQQLEKQPGIVEKRMFGGVAFMFRGNICCGVHKQALMVRLAPDEAEAALRKPHSRPFDITGRPMKRWLLVEADGIKSAAALRKWVKQALDYAGSLPAK